MRHSNGDKIVVNRGADGHYVYFSVRDDDDNGSIIDFVQRRDRISLRCRAEGLEAVDRTAPGSCPLLRSPSHNQQG